MLGSISGRSPEPSALATNTCFTPLATPSRVNAMRVASGDHDGSLSLSGDDVSGDRLATRRLRCA